MSFAYLALYTGDYLRDTRHLTPLKHGVYLLLLMHCWDSHGPVPLDEQEAAGICNCRSADEIDAVRYILERYFMRMADGWYNKRIQREIERAEEISGKRSHAAFKRHAGRQSDATQHANAEQMQSKCNALDANTTPISISTPRKVKTVAKGADTWEAYRQAYLERYRVEPVRNTSVNSMIGKLVDRLGAEIAPRVAAYYLTHDKAFYVGAKHSVAILLRDAEGIHTDWATGQHTTQTTAMQADKRQSNKGVFEKLIEESEYENRKP